jgi:para-aminobenzoate N-oxygenase AurF
MPAATFERTLHSSQRVQWTLDEVLPAGSRLDFTRRFLPEALARVDSLRSLSPDERRLLNQIRGHAYLRIFGLVEEFILPFVLDHARPSLDADDFRTRALLQFAGEEAKHIQLFKRFAQAFEQGFGRSCRTIGPPKAVADAILAHDPLGVALVILHIEWMTQRHFVDSVATEESLDPLMRSLLRHHWLEEVQHAQLDTHMVELLAKGRDEKGVAAGVDAYLSIGTFLDQGLASQVGFDLEALEQASGRRLRDDERAEIGKAQHQANRWTYLGSGMSHPEFLATVGRLSAAQRARLEAIAPAFS